MFLTSSELNFDFWVEMECSMTALLEHFKNEKTTPLILNKPNTKGEKMWKK